MNSKILGLLAVGSIVGPITANSQTPTYTYTYQGEAFTSGSLNITPPPGTTFVAVPPNTRVVPLYGFITLSAPLGDNLNDASVSPTYTSLNSSSPLFNGVFAFSTNGKGAIVGWSMSLSGNVGGPGGYTTTATSVDFDGVGGTPRRCRPPARPMEGRRRSPSFVDRQEAIRHQVFGRHPRPKLRRSIRHRWPVA